MLKAIVCVDKNWSIGRTNKKTGKGELLFHLPEDLKFYKDTTKYKTVVFGENTLLSLPNSKPLPNRINIVLCQPGHDYPGCICYSNFNDLIEYLKVSAKERDVYISGGAMLYKSTLEYVDEVLVTKVFADGNGEVFFTNLDKSKNFKLKEAGEKLNNGEYEYQFVVYERVKNEEADKK